MKISTLIATLLLVAGFTFTAQAQIYNSAIGARLGYPLSVSYKQFLNEGSAIEAFAGFRSWTGYSWFNIGGLYQIHKPIESVDGLQWYFGGGASVYFWTFDNVFLENNASTTFGILGVIGLDYKFADIPLSITADWMPALFINGYGSGFGGGYGALGVRYVLK